MSNHTTDDWNRRFQSWKSSKKQPEKETLHKHPIVNEKISPQIHRQKEPEKSVKRLSFTTEDLIWKVVPYIFLVILIVIALNQHFHWPVIQVWNWQIITLGILTGAGTFWRNRENIENELKQEKDREKAEETEREREFSSKFPISSKIPVLKSLTKWVYKEGWLYSLILFLILLNALLIGFNNLGTLPLQNDEFLTQGAIKYILDGNLKFTDLKFGADLSSSTDFYSRGLPYSILAAISVKILGGDYFSYFNLRFFSALCGFLLLIVFYLLIRKDLTKIASIFCILGLSFFYITAYYSRISRMYSLFMLIFFILVLIFIRLYDNFKKEELTGYHLRSYLPYLRKNIFGILTFLILLIIGLKVHYDTVFILPIILFFILANLKIRTELKTILLIGFFLALFLFIYFIGPGLIGEWYFNSRGEVYLKFIGFNYQYLSGGIACLVLFLASLINYPKEIPSIIKFSFISVTTITPLFVFLFNGTQFHEPRYMMFIYPFFIIGLIYAINIIVIKFLTKKSTLLKILSFFILFILLVTPIQINGVCLESKIVSCPISHESKIFNLDRWNYNYDQQYETIKKNLDNETIIVGRSIYNFYIEKYNISNEVFQLINLTELENPPIKYSSEELKNKRVIFILYPQLVYVAGVKKFNEVYNDLVSKKSSAKLIYKSSDNKTQIFIFNSDNVPNN